MIHLGEESEHSIQFVRIHKRKPVMNIFVFHQGKSSHFNHQCRWSCCSSLCSTVALQYRCRRTTAIVKRVSGQHHWITHQWHSVIIDMLFVPQQRCVHADRCERSERGAVTQNDEGECECVCVCVEKYCCVTNECFLSAFILNCCYKLYIFMLSVWCVCVHALLASVFYCICVFVYVTHIQVHDGMCAWNICI